MMRVLSAGEIFAAPREAPMEVAVPEWGGAVFVRMLTAGERDRFETMALDGKSKGRHVRALLVCACACDFDGNRLFTDGDLPRISELDAAPVDRVFAAAMRLNRIGAAEVAELEQFSADRSESG
jgi:hypothetical protein